MTPAEFLGAVLPSDGYYCLAIPKPGGGWRHKVFETIEQVARVASTASAAEDVYFCMHTLSEPKVWNSDKLDWQGNPGVWQIRTQANTKAVKCLFWDLDVGDSDKKYTSQGAALAGLKDFCKAIDLPLPMVVSSGGGLHAYWLFNETISADDFRNHAAKLKALGTHYGVMMDKSRTTDSSSVLRVAGTLNHKDPKNPRTVTVLKQGKASPVADIVKILDDALIRAGIDVSPIATVKHLKAGPLGSNTAAIEFDGPPVTVKALITACPQVQRFARLKGNVSEDEWYHGIIGLVRFTENGKANTHKMSAGHPRYSVSDVDIKLHQHESVILADGSKLGPTSCNKLADVAGSDLCEGCVFHGRVKSPIVAARFKDEAPAPVLTEVAGPTVHTTELPPPPPPFTRLKDGKIAVLAKNKDGDEVHTVIYEHDLYPIKRVVNAVLETEQQVWRVVLPREGEKDFMLDADALYDKRKFVAAISNQGIYPQSNHVQFLQDYMIAYIAELQRLQDADAQYNHLGWSEDLTEFILPDKILQADGTAKPSMLSLGATRASQQVHKAGTLQKQVELLRFYKNPAYLANQFFVVAGLAAPLFHVTGHHGVIINASGEAGASKSTSLYTSASHWGHPNLYPINGTTGGATTRARNERVTTLANLPICVDEVTHIPVKEAIDLAMGITQPGHRLRLDTHGIERNSSGGHKSTIMLTTANSSLHSLLSTDNAAGTAGSMRVFEIHFAATRVHKKHEADVFLRELKQNYGHIGEVFMAHYMQNRAAIDQRIIDKIREIDEATDIQASERYWSATGVIIVVNEVANELGLLSYSSAELQRWLVEEQIPYMRGVVGEEYTNPLGVLANYLEHINGDILVINKPDNFSNMNLGSSILRHPRGQLAAHYDTDEKVMWVLKKPFKDYCVRIGANAQKLITDLNMPVRASDGTMQRIISNKHVRKVLGAGTDYAKAQSWTIAVNMAHPDVSGVVDVVMVDGGGSTSAPAGKLKAVK